MLELKTQWKARFEKFERSEFDKLQAKLSAGQVEGEYFRFKV